MTPRSIPSAREVISLGITVSTSWLTGMDPRWVIGKVIIDQAVLPKVKSALLLKGSQVLSSESAGINRQMVSMIVISMTKVASDGIEQQWTGPQMLMVFLVAMASIVRSGH